MTAIVPDFKRCCRCGVVKRSADFYRHSGKRDGLQQLCKPCHVEANRASRLRHADARLASRRRYEAENSAAENARKIAWKRANREKHLAHRAVYRAVRRGDLVRPDECERCGPSDFKILAHHEDYSRPLDVMWLCGPCHAQRHIELETATTTYQVAA